MKFLLSDLFKAIEKEEITEFFDGIPKTDTAIEIECMKYSISHQPGELRDNVRLLLRAMRALPMHVKKVSFVKIFDTSSTVAFINMEPHINSILSDYRNLEIIERFFFGLNLIAADRYGNKLLFNPNKPSRELQINLINIVGCTEHKLLQVGLPKAICKITVDYITAGFSFFSHARERDNQRDNQSDNSETLTIKFEG